MILLEEPRIRELWVEAIGSTLEEKGLSIAKAQLKDIWEWGNERCTKHHTGVPCLTW
jgi:hypothetical protein